MVLQPALRDLLQFARWRTCHRRCHWLVRGNRIFNFSDWLGHWRRLVRCPGGPLWPGQNAGFHHPDLCAVYRPGGAVANLVGTRTVPVYYGARYRRRMGGGRGTGRRSLAGGETHPGGGAVAVGVGGRISGSGHPEPAPAPPRLASHVRCRCRPGGGRPLRLFVGQGNQNAGSRRMPRNNEPAPRVRQNWRNCLRRDWFAPHWSGPGWRLWLCSVFGARRTGRRRSSALCRICGI